MKIPVDILRQAWIAGTLERRRLTPKDSPLRALWKSPEDLWNEASDEYAQSMAACARVIEDFVTWGDKKEKGGKDKK